MLIELTLFCALLQQPTPAPTITLPLDHRVALVFSPTDIREMRLDEAERRYRALEARKRTATLDNADARLHAALTIALGTLHDERLIVPRHGTRERMDWEVRRGVRRAAQRLDNANIP